MTASRSAVPRPDAHVHFGVFFQGVNHTTIWSDSASGSQIDFETFRRLVLTAERGLFDAFFLGEGLRLREQNGKILDLDIAGRPDAIAQLAALAGTVRRDHSRAQIFILPVERSPWLTSPMEPSSDHAVCDHP